MRGETVHRCTRAAAPLAVLAAGFFFSTQSAPAKPDYTRRTSQTCEFCHPPNSRALNEAGRYYQEHKNSLAGYKPKEPAKSKTPDNTITNDKTATRPPSSR